MKKIIFCFVCIATILSLASCKFIPNEQNDGREEYIMKYEKRLNMMEVTINQSLIEDERYSGMPWITERVQLPNSEIIVSKDSLKMRIHVYELQNGKELKLTAEDIIDLYTIPNEEKQAEFDKFVEWYQNNHGSHCKYLYSGFLGASYRIYENANGKPFIAKERKMYAAEDWYALAKWSIENIDYDFIEKTIKNSNYSNKKNEDGSVNFDALADELYVEYLYGLGLINKNGEAITKGIE